MMSRRLAIVALSSVAMLGAPILAWADEVCVMMESAPAANAVIAGRSSEFFVRFDWPVDHIHSTLDIVRDGKHVGLPNHDDHSTFPRCVSLKPFGGELAIAQNSRLCGMPDENCFTEAAMEAADRHGGPSKSRGCWPPDRRGLSVSAFQTIRVSHPATSATHLRWAIGLGAGGAHEPDREEIWRPSRPCEACQAHGCGPVPSGRQSPG